MPVRRQGDFVLLSSKLSVPPLRSRMVPSTGLVRRLQQGARGRLTLISAPAGFGKTTLVCQWIEQHKMPVAWYSLDETDNEASVFYRYLLTSLQGLDPSLRAAFDPLLQGRTVVGKTVIGTILNQLSRLTGPFHLVLDDFHVIHTASLHEDILYLLRHCPPHLHLTIITREDPPLPLSRYRASREVTELKIQDLQFSLEETVDFFRQTMRLTLPIQDMSELHALTEGWIVGLQAVGLSLRKSGGPARRPVAKALAENKHMLDYLFEEVLQDQSADVQDFLLKTSILNHLTPELCSHVTGADYSVNMLEQLEHKNLFIVPLDESAKWYRYHALFSRMLRRQLQSAQGHSLAELHKKASDWYGGHGYLDEAFNHAFASRDAEFAADLLENMFLTLIDNYEWAAARRWLESLPEEVLQRRFLLRLYHALVIFLQEELLEMDSLIRDLESSFAEMTGAYSEERRRHAADLLLALKINCLCYTEPARVAPVAEAALQRISPRNIMARGLVQGALSTAYMQQGDLQPAMDVVRSGLDAFAHPQPGRNRYVRVQLLNRQARLEFLFGHLRSADALLSDALDYARREDPPLRAAMAMFNITAAQIRYGQDRLEEALNHASRCVEYARPVSDIGYLLLGLKMQAFVNQRFGNAALATELIHEAVRIAGQTESSVRVASTELAEVELASMQLDLGSMERWASRRNLAIDEPFSRNFEKECLLLARFYMASGRLDEAAELLDAIRPRVARRRRSTSLTAIEVLRAACLSGLGREQAALDTLAACIEVAGPEGYVRPFVENADLLIELLFALRTSPKGVVRVQAAKLLKACELSLSDACRPAGLGPGERLSQREVEVLRLVFAGMTNKEIAHCSFISLNTVKTHIRNIYCKLGVATREQAILKARESNYL